MKKHFLRSLLIVFLINLTSCTKNDEFVIDNEIIGHWQMYKTEVLESVIDQWTGTTFTRKDKWFSNNHNDSRIFIEFYDDGTFTEFYAETPVFKGVWGKKLNIYFYKYKQDNNNEHLVKTRFIEIYCNNSFSIKSEGDARNINYFRKKETTECNDKINYKVQ
ncbi:MAG: hypothetical protein P8H13_09665 [Polaribacter sp.]|nr:hypothetical protein [Polaribacter sp.]MDG1812188.1 hypothetical protein [Polaribacter sp.]MDG1993689.1 hypothetical protein [Polaribacter sp.]